MALDFPSNPVDGEAFGSYVWVASKGVWQSREESAAVAITSPTAPTEAKNGDIWYNTNRGVTYVYYDDGSSSQWVESVTSGLPALEQVMPTGSVIQTARASAPLGWMICDGTSLLVADYQNLFNAIGYAYGGSGSNFSLPNLKGRIPVGRDAAQVEFDTLGEVGGSKTHTLTIDQMPSHTHTQNSHNHTQDAHSHNMSSTSSPNGDFIGRLGGGQGGWALQNADGSNNNIYRLITAPVAATNQPATATNQNTGGGQAHNILQPYVVMNYIIRV